jgi:hypothetical protein
VTRNKRREQEAEAMEATGRALVELWRMAARSGLMEKSTAAGYRIACKHVLSALDDPEGVHVSTLDVEDALRRFEKAKKRKFQENVLEAYKRRFRRAVGSFLEYLDDPDEWKPPGAGAVGGKGGAEQRRSTEIPEGSVEYRFPVREGQDAYLVLPRDLRSVEAKRLAAFISTLVVESDR